MPSLDATDPATAAAVRLSLSRWLSQQIECDSLQVIELSAPTQGFSNQTLFASAVIGVRSGERKADFVLRLPPAGEALFPHYDLAIQFRCMQQVAVLGIPTPPLIGYEGSSELFGAPFYVMEKVDGQVPSENPLYGSTGWLFNAAPQVQRQHWRRAIELLGQIARLDPAHFDFLPQPRSGLTHLGEQIVRSHDFLRWIEARSQPYPHLHSALAWLQAHRPSHEEPPGLCWGDAKLGNCIFGDGNLVAALDWESAHLDDPVDDLAWWLVLDRSLSEGYGVPRLPGFPARNETVALWEQAAARSARNLAYYEVLCAFKFATIMARLGWLYAQRGLVPATQRMDLHNGGSSVLAMLGAEHGF